MNRVKQPRGRRDQIGGGRPPQQETLRTSRSDVPKAIKGSHSNVTFNLRNKGHVLAFSVMSSTEGSCQKVPPISLLDRDACLLPHARSPS